MFIMLVVNKHPMKPTMLDKKSSHINRNLSKQKPAVEGWSRICAAMAEWQPLLDEFKTWYVAHLDLMKQRNKQNPRSSSHRRTQKW